MVDSVLFVPLVFGSLTAVPGRLTGKTGATLLALAVLPIATVAARWMVKRP